MSNEKFVEKLKEIKNLKAQNREKIEKITNFDLERRKKLITNIVNLRIIKKMIDENVIYYNGYKLSWIGIDNELSSVSIDEAISDLEKQLK